ncbi:hypothetical protein CSW25_10480 [Thermus scotoductus]|uniref:Uncharacterized protein n=2 Tax=Thermus TaxID=270 RepID=A0A430S5M2_THESC|nr:hypothetical protein [Thermus scotoductus]RTG95843.1 hypothetical protein CSW48_05320 [Thermus scotoductus]RTH04327.1 hypothetical protein CSW50_02980 [Thermus scotoductus]RTH10074.1 hypothetical protein CSW43_09940 [Thermus scotoductus]RTH11048.1 hypothetical protein CSW46_05505 [Thermus scotoductus]RTH13254.1 hypothetical protein CSW44_02415 [Thermus scotoductus]
MPRTKERSRTQTSLVATDQKVASLLGEDWEAWHRQAEEVALEPPERPRPWFRPWRGKGKGVLLDDVLQDLRH